MTTPVQLAPTADLANPQPVASPARPAARVQRLGGLRVAVAATFGTRLLVWPASIAAIGIFGKNLLVRHMLDPDSVTTPAHSALGNLLLAPAARWDSVWYLQIAQHGYFKAAAANFFPLYPLVVHIVTPLFGNAVLAGLAVSMSSMVVALTLLHRLTVLDMDESAARMTVLLVAAFPTSLFMSAVYPTSLFLLLTLAAAYAARSDRWAVAGICGALAAAVRSNGILVLVLLGLMYLYGPRGRSPLRNHGGAWWQPRFPIERDVGWLALVPAGIAAYLLYLLAAHGAPLAPFRAAHTYWHHAFGAPLASIVKVVGQVPGDLRAVITRTTTPIGPDPLSLQPRNLIDVGFLVVAVASVVAAWNRVPRVYVIYSIVQLVYITSFPAGGEPLIGLPRYLLAIFPLFMGAGTWLAKRRVAAGVTLAVSTALLVVFSGLWGYWAVVP